MFSNLSQKLLGGEPRSIIVVRPASVKGFISGALNLGWLIISSLANQLVYIIALIVGLVVGLSQSILKVSVGAIQSPFKSPSKRSTGRDDQGVEAEVQLPQPMQEKEADDLRPRHLFVEPYDGLVDEQRGTEMHTPDDLIGPGTVEQYLVTAPEYSPAVPVYAAAEREFEKTEEDAIAVIRSSPPVISKKTPEPSPPKVVSPDIISPESISSVDRFTASTLEDTTLISSCAKRSGAPSPPPSSRATNVVVPAQHPFHAPETPNIDYKNTVDLPSEQQPPISSAAPAALAAPAAPTVEKVTEAASEISHAKPSVVENNATLPQIFQHEEDEEVMRGSLKKKKKKQRGPMHKAFHKIRKAFR